MSKLLILVLIAWVLGKIFGTRMRKNSQAAGPNSQGQHQAAPRNRDGMLEQQRERAEAYRRAQAAESAQTAPEAHREHPWTLPGESQPVRAAAAKAVGVNAPSPIRPGPRSMPDQLGITGPAPAVKAVAPTAKALPQLGFGHDDLVRAIMMAEILGPCKARRS